MIRILAFLLLAAASVHDIRRLRVTRGMLVAAAFLSVASVLWEGIAAARTTLSAETDAPRFLMQVLLSFVPGLALLGLGFLSREGIGYGDGLFALLIGPVFGCAPMAAGIAVAFFLSALLSVVLLALRRAGRKSELPFLPFFSSGMGVVLFVFR